MAEDKKSSEADVLFNQLKSVSPAREVALEEGLDDISSGSMSERAEESPNLTDVQSALKVLLPKLKGYLNVIQVSRIFPDVYNALLELLTIDLLETDENISVVEAIFLANTVLSIAIDGEGRIDVIALYGKAAETESASKDKLGLP